MYTPSYRQIVTHGEFIDYVTAEQHVNNIEQIRTVYTEEMYRYRDVYYIINRDTFTARTAPTATDV